MQFRTFGRQNNPASVLGFGCMRLPVLDGRSERSGIDEAEALRIIRHAIDSGVNYIDTAYFYHDGQSEVLVGKALKDGYRDKVRLVTKSPVNGIVNRKEDYRRILDEQLKRLNEETVDLYLFHGLNKKSWGIVQSEDLIGCALKAKQEGKIREIGFSFHDEYSVFEEIVNGYDGWSMCQIQYNYMDTDRQAGTRGLKLAASKGLAVVVMEPILGGKLANPPEAIQRLIRESGYPGTPADLALQWVWNQPEVSVVLSGMSNMNQVQQNLDSAERSGIGTLSTETLALIEKIKAYYNAADTIPCTTCKYCMPCPSGVNIPRNIKVYNEAITYQNTAEAGKKYANMKSITGTPESADLCIGCGTCEEKCPQKISIRSWMEQIDSFLGQK